MPNSTDKQDPRRGYRSSLPDTVGTLFKPAYPIVAPSVQQQIGLRLRQFYESLAPEESPIPDRFIEHGGRDELLADIGLDVNGLIAAAKSLAETSPPVNQRKVLVTAKS